MDCQEEESTMDAKKLQLAEIFQSNMMLQRDKEMILWGTAAPGATVTAGLYAGSSQNETAEPAASGSAKADANGDFKLTLPAQSAGEGFFLRVTADLNAPQLSGAGQSADAERLVLENISFGDIWLAAGQSNMEFFLRYDKDWEKTKLLPRNPKIRMFNTPQRAYEGHTTHNKMGYGYWFTDSDKGTEVFSAPAYSFARNVQEATGIPIGLIGCNWGGSSASTWVPESVLEAAPLNAYLKEYEDAVAGIPEEKLKEDSLSGWDFEDSAQHGKDFEPLMYGQDRDWQLAYMEEHAQDPVIPMGPYNFDRPAGLYHTMLSKLIPFPIKGVIWYQGESDSANRAPYYDKLLTGLIEDWRKEWNDTFPFLQVQLAPFGEWLACTNDGYALVRQKQQIVSDTVPDVYLASIMDIGSYYDIHPKEKMEVGRRLALLARGHVYGEKDLLCDAPRAIRATRNGNGQIDVEFAHAEGLTIEEKKSDWVITDGTQAMQPAEIAAAGSHILLTLPQPLADQSTPLTVSLGDKDYAEIHIHNASGLSAMPFCMNVG
jgi:sialate O-acetylesterase